MKTIAKKYKFISDEERIIRFYRAGDFHLPLYRENMQFDDESPTVSLTRKGEHRKLVLKTDYEIHGEILILKIALHEDDLIRSTHYVSY